VRLAAQGATDSLQAIADSRQSSEARCRRLAELQEQGVLDLATAMAALRDDDEGLRRTAVAIVRHEWAELPQTLFEGLDASPAAARTMLEELAIAPRPAAAAWAARRTLPAPGRSDDERCLALAAQGRPLVAADMELLLQALLAGEADDGYRAAAAITPADVADGLLGRLHACLLQGQLDVVQVGPLFDRLSDQGCRALLGLAVTLPPPVGATICQRVAERDPGLVRERARAMLDGETPLEALWLAYAGPLLDRAEMKGVERKERVLQILRDEQADARLQQSAFDALLDARIVADPVIRFATADGADIARLQRLLDAAVDQVPGPRLVSFLGGDAQRSTATVKALSRRQVLGEDVERALLGLLAGQERIEGVFFETAAMALVLHGSAAALNQVWPSVRGSRRWSDFVDALARRREPFVHELLVTELGNAKATGLDEQQRALDDVRLALVALGDRRQLAELVAHAKVSSATFVRRCRHFATSLTPALALMLLNDLTRVEDDDLAAEMMAWAATSTDPAVLVQMHQVWGKDTGESRALELQEVALRALVIGPGRDDLVAELRQAIAKAPLPERLEPLGYELAATMPQPLPLADLRLLAELVLLPPLTDPEREVRSRKRWGNGRFGFPMTAAVAQRLRGADPACVATAFDEVVGEVLRDSRHTQISRQRLMVLWGNLEADRDVLTAVGIATAPLMLALPQAPEVGTGPAHWFLLQDAERRRNYAQALAHSKQALGALLRLPEERRTARLFLGERDPGAGRDPWAALAAAPHRIARAKAMAAGDVVAAAAAATLVREFAGRDAQSLVPPTPAKPKEVVR
jgi:hypothetical protein